MWHTRRAPVAVLDIGIGATAQVTGHLLHLGRRTRVASGALIRPMNAVTMPVVGLAGQPLRYAASHLPVGSVRVLAESGRQNRSAVVSALSAWANHTVTGLVRGLVDIDVLVRDVDVSVILEGLDLAALTERLMADIDLPEIIRGSTSVAASDAVRGVRMQGIAADAAVGRTLGRIMPGRARQRTGDGS